MGLSVYIKGSDGPLILLLCMNGVLMYPGFIPLRTANYHTHPLTHLNTHTHTRTYPISYIHTGFYLGSIGGPAAILALNCIKKVEVLEYVHVCVCICIYLSVCV